MLAFYTNEIAINKYKSIFHYDSYINKKKISKTHRCIFIHKTIFFLIFGNVSTLMCIFNYFSLCVIHRSVCSAQKIKILWCVYVSKKRKTRFESKHIFYVVFTFLLRKRNWNIKCNSTFPAKTLVKLNERELS